MSEIDHYKGRLEPVLICNGDLEGAAKGLYGNRPQLPEYYDNYLEWLVESGEHYVNADNTAIYVVQKEKIDAYDDIMTAIKGDDESISFEVKYYNGGCSFGEALDNSISAMNASREVA